MGVGDPATSWDRQRETFPSFEKVRQDALTGPRRLASVGSEFSRSRGTSQQNTVVPEWPVPTAKHCAGDAVLAKVTPGAFVNRLPKAKHCSDDAAEKQAEEQAPP